MADDVNSSDPTGVLIVLARSPESITEDAFVAWFRSHLPEILAIPCFTAARLLDLKLFASAPGRELPYRYMAIYDFDGTAETAMAAIGEARANNEFKLPQWFDEFEREDCLVSWTGVPA
jgi:hypothetical protein